MGRNIETADQLIRQLDRPSVPVHKRIGEILLEAGVINLEQLREALRVRNDHPEKGKLGKIIQSLGYATGTEVMKALSLNLNIPCVSLNHMEVENPAIDFVPAEFARSHNLVPLILHKDRLVVAMEEPMDNETLNLLHFMTGHHVEPVLATAADIELAVSRVYGQADDQDVLKGLPEYEIEEPEEELVEEQAKRLAHEKPVVRLVQNLILDAIHRRASDVHIRPMEHRVDIIFRIDGSLIPIRNMPRSMLSAIVSRIKIIGGMNIAERRLPQDGRTRIRTHDRSIDLRLSVMPSIHGESVVIRILDTGAGMKSLSEIGFTEQDETRFRGLIQKSAGMILVTGPTGSGKSTTLYSALQEVLKSNINIITVEDPVEYHIDGITQIQVNSLIGYTFARALRNILRHDPDAIMIGEIRDEETAKMAVESALTGHLVLSTLHTNSAATTITRLLEIGMPSYLVSATLLAVLAQRLVKKNCPHCLQEEIVAPAIREVLGLDEKEVFYRGKGCDHCHQTGYSGRIAVYELLQVTEELRPLIRPNASALDIEKVAVSNGMEKLTQQALRVARRKETSLAEVYRVRLD